MLFLNVLLLLMCTITLNGMDFVTISAPADGATVTAVPLSISGTSSRANFRVRLKINSTEFGSATTDGSGNWAFAVSMTNGSYTLTADLMSPAFETYATAANNFTIQNPQTISITRPAENDLVFLSPSIVEGVTSLASGVVNLSIDASLVATTTADASGNWSAAYNLTTNGLHTLLAQLMVSGSPVASSSVNITGAVPIIFSTSIAGMRILRGEVLTTGSGSGVGFIYTVAGSIVTINMSPPFATVPSVFATGMRASGLSTVSVASATTSAINITFGTGTTKIYFLAVVFV